MLQIARKTSLLFTALCCAVMSDVGEAAAQSVVRANDGTGTQVNQSGQTFDISGGTQAGANLFQSFQKFGLSQGETANFIANPSIQNILGRVVGGEASVINGLLQVTGSNANLYLMNPAGIVFGSNARLDVAGSFTATTANGIGLGDQWFNAIGSNNYANLIGKPNRFAFTMQQPGAIVNAGNLAVGQGQRITLLGGALINTGTLTAPGGNITIVASPGERVVTILQDGSLLSLALPLATGATIQPLPFTPLSLPQLLTGGSLTHAGVTVENGVVRLTGANLSIPSEAGTTIVSNTVNASGNTGGTVHILGKRVGLVNATIDASGSNGGGTVLIGGDYRGQGNLPNAQRTFVSPDAVIRVDAQQQGNGGRVIVWADGATSFRGGVSARGAQTGAGGFVEISGKQALEFDGNVDVSSPGGQSGQLLLDPDRVVIGTNGANNNELNDGQILADDSPETTFFISTDRVLQALNNGSVSIAATNDITINSPLRSASTAYQSSRGSRLALTAAQINLLADLALFGDIDVQASQAITIANRQIESAGNLSLATQGNVGLTNTALAASGNLSLQGQVVSLRSGRLESGGNLTVRSRQNLTVVDSRLWANGNLRLQADAVASFTESTAPQRPLTIQTDGDLLIQGNTGVTIQALGLPQSAIRSGGNLSLVSDGIITGNTRFAAGGNFSTSNTTGGTGNFNYNPVNAIGTGIITALGDVNFGNYEGVSLKIEAGGNIQGGNIRITAANTGLSGTDPDIALLSAIPSLILRAGLAAGTSLPNTPRPMTVLQNAPNTSLSQAFGGTTFTLNSSPAARGNITVGTIATAPSTTPTLADTAVILSAPGTITTDTITTGRTGSPANTQPGGSVQIAAIGDIRTADIVASSNRSLALRQPIALTSRQGNITTGEIQVFGQNAFVSLVAARNIEVAVINNRAPGGSVEIASGGLFRATRAFSSGQSSTAQVYNFPDRAAFRTFLQRTTLLRGIALENLLDQLIQPPTEEFVSIRVNPVPSYRADSSSFAIAGTPLLRILHEGSFFVSGPIDPGSVGSGAKEFSTVNINLLPANFSGTAGAIIFSTPNASLAQSFSNAVFQPNIAGSYLQVTTVSPPPTVPTDQTVEQQFTRSSVSRCTPSNTVASASRSADRVDRSGGFTSAALGNLCVPVGTDDEQILQILGE